MRVTSATWTRVISAILPVCSLVIRRIIGAPALNAALLRARASFALAQVPLEFVGVIRAAPPCVTLRARPSKKHTEHSTVHQATARHLRLAAAERAGAASLDRSESLPTTNRRVASCKTITHASGVSGHEVLRQVFFVLSLRSATRVRVQNDK